MPGFGELAAAVIERFVGELVLLWKSPVCCSVCTLDFEWEISGSGSRGLTATAGGVSVSNSAAVKETTMSSSIVPAVNSAVASESVFVGNCSLSISAAISGKAISFSRVPESIAVGIIDSVWVGNCSAAIERLELVSLGDCSPTLETSEREKMNITPEEQLRLSACIQKVTKTVKGRSRKLNSCVGQLKITQK